MSEVNFTVNQDAIAIIQNTSIEANFDECKTALKEMIAPYASMIVTEDSVSEAKAERAKIHKVEAHIGDMRIAVKKSYMKPFDEFAEKCNELIEICASGSNNLDKQIKSFENGEADAKIAEIRAAYEKVAVGELLAFCPWEFVYSAKWRNKGVSKETAIVDVEAAVRATANDLTAIRATGGPDTAYLLDVYKQTHELSAVVRKASELKAMREREAARRREAEPPQFMGAVTAAAAERVAEIIRSAENAPVAGDNPQDEPLVTVAFRVQCTKSQLAALGQYMKDNGIRYGRA